MKNKILGALKLFILVYARVMGFFLTYGLVWVALDLPATKWALVLLYALAVLTEYGYYRWIREG